eukprot:jgi/Ulvmu1/3158/UM015_0198.1
MLIVQHASSYSTSQYLPQNLFTLHGAASRNRCQTSTCQRKSRSEKLKISKSQASAKPTGKTHCTPVSEASDASEVSALDCVKSNTQGTRSKQKQGSNMAGDCCAPVC